MFVDARTVPRGQKIRTDICVIGAGAAGITLARELANTRLDVALLESGRFERDEETQTLCDGEIVGQPYHPLISTRLRQFGGTTNHWTGACRPLEAIDFEARDWVPHSGWPFDRAHLEPYYQRAQAVCELGPFTYDASAWSSKQSSPLPFEAGRATNTVFQFSPPTRFGRLYREKIAAAANITTYLNANVTDLDTTENARTATYANVACLRGTRFRVWARVFVLAAGAIENARLLLLSNRVRSSGLGNEHDLVGRFFMEHPHIYTGLILPTEDSLITDFYRTRSIDNVRVRGAITVSEDAVREEKLLGFAAFLNPFHIPGEESLDYLAESLRQGRPPGDLLWHLKRVLVDIGHISEARCRRMLGTSRNAISLHNRSEQSPNPDSRVTLGESKDALGKNITVLDWRLNEIDKSSLRRAHELVAIELGRAGLGRFKVELDSTPVWPPDLAGGNHHMGTTRMHHDANRGVVDANCRVHNLSNLYVAGSSVFPTAGFSNPTLTLVALALRLADHFKTQSKLP